MIILSVLHLIIFGALWKDLKEKTRLNLLVTFFWPITFVVMVILGGCAAFGYLVITVVEIALDVVKTIRGKQ